MEVDQNYDVDLERGTKIVVKFTTGKIYRLKFKITTMIKQYN